MNVQATLVRDQLPLPRVLTLLLASAFAFLVIDIRLEHVEAVREHSIAWLPIIYSALMAVACLLAFVFWNASIRRIMFFLFLIAFVIGGSGFFFHNRGKIREVTKSSINAWIDPKMEHVDGPPQMAPLAFGGLGMIGALASVRRFNPS